MKGKKWRDVRNALVMVIVMVAMMSSATFAWFTLTNSPTVAGLQMTAASSTGLTVSNNGSDYYSAITIADSNTNDDDGVSNTPLKLTPVTTTASGFCEPQYSGGYVSGLKTAMGLTKDDLKGKVAVYEYFIKADGIGNDETVNVGLIIGNPTQTAQATVTENVANAAGTFIRKLSTASEEKYAQRAVRIGFILKGSDATGVTSSDFSNMVIYEPNNTAAGDKLGGAEAGIASGFTNQPGIASKVISDTSGKITVDNGTGTANTVGTDVTKQLFQVTGKGNKMYMFVWLEGTDQDCVDSIKTGEMEAQVQFTIVE